MQNRHSSGGSFHTVKPSTSVGCALLASSKASLRGETISTQFIKLGIAFPWASGLELGERGTNIFIPMRFRVVWGRLIP